MSTWVDRQGLYNRYGQEYIEKLARRRDFDPSANGGSGGYVENTSSTRVNEIINIAIEDAKTWMLWKISCCFNIQDFNLLLADNKEFSFLQRFHIKLTIILLKHGGDCAQCDECKAEISEVCSCSEICTDDGICIPSRKRSKFSVEKTEPSCLPTKVCCGSCSNRCSCVN